MGQEVFKAVAIRPEGPKCNVGILYKCFNCGHELVVPFELATILGSKILCEKCGGMTNEDGTDGRHWMWAVGQRTLTEDYCAAFSLS
jgi:DNA-directed RNA polymerase subunit RPC12/RpoP